MNALGRHLLVELYDCDKEALNNLGFLREAMLTELLNLTAVYNTLKGVFKVVAACAVHMPCFGAPWGFCIASNSADPSRLSPAEVDKRIAARSLPGLKMYDGVTHRGMFSLPGYVRDAMERQTRIITDKDPLYLYSA